MTLSCSKTVRGIVVAALLAFGAFVPVEAQTPDANRLWTTVGSAGTVDEADVSKIVFDHTSLIKTILERFCRHDDGTIPNMGTRVANANHLGHLLTRDVPLDPPPFDHVLPALKGA